jgi:hypothetical protein
MSKLVPGGRIRQCERRSALRVHNNLQRRFACDRSHAFVIVSSFILCVPVIHSLAALDPGIRKSVQAREEASLRGNSALGG